MASPPRPPSAQPPSPACLKPHEVSLFLQGQLPPERRQRVAAHLGGCARCRAELAPTAVDPTRPAAPVRPSDPPVLDETRAEAPLRRPQDSAVPQDFEPGGRVGRYVIERVLGMGGMGAVYLAHDPELHRRVAIKRLHSWMSERPEHEEHKTRFLREAQAMASVSHPNVVAIHDLLHVEGSLFVAMEYVEGTTLREWARTPRSTRQILEVFRQAGVGLAAAHAAGLIHRDIKPSNILIGVDGSVRVSDFGLARSREGVPEASRPEGAPGQERWLGQELTQAGLVVGTPGYMAPEQMTLLAPVDERSDQFSFCVALYETLHGCRPFAGDNDAEVEWNIRTRRFQPSRTRARVPPWLNDVVLRGLSHEPKERFPNMEALLQALARDPAREQESARSRVRRRVRRGVLLGLLATGLVMALAPTRAWRGFEERAQGLLLTARPRPWNKQVVLLAIDQPSIDTVGWPQPRHVQAKMVEALGRAGVKALGIDSFLYLPARDGPGADAALGEAIARYGRVVLAAPCTFEANDKARALAQRLESSSLAPGPSPRFGCQGVLAPQEPLLRGSVVAQVEVARSASGNVRGAYLLSNLAGRALPTFALSMYMRGLGLPVSDILQEPDGVRLGALHVPTDDSGAVLASFRGPGAMDVLSYGALYAELAQAQEPVFPPALAEHLKDKYVLVGQTAESVRDLGPFANGQTLPLVLLHASLLSDLLEARPVRELPLGLQLALIALCGALLTAAVLVLRPSLTFASVLVVLLGVVGGALLLAERGVVLGPLGPMVASVLAFGLVLAGRLSADEQERSRMRHTFEGYVDDAELARLVSASEAALSLEGSRQRVSVLCAWVQGSTGALERLPPEEVVGELREVLDGVVHEVLARKGRVDSLRGEGVLAVFGDPLRMVDHARRAVEAALAVQARLEARVASRVALEVRVGVATGEALVGNVGPRGGRWEYTVLGSPMEQARQLARRAPRGGVLVSADTQETCGGRFAFTRTHGTEAGQLAFVVRDNDGSRAA
ncbi:hypothetical protein D187_005033 [Cystobacter fuscus DSM 2262]|uniref:Uncharacterized protein n=1 Tax=Cystobacter fuscus (strain ATCC 25194 / DSM 2262 / NBRC 100088 / M29) TaxID=1242864 RepID=S9R4Q7_CYSF2|nr:CHASE2 domain-containing protein [Cystobacter fuscus]EPX63903.1 hypothetical protein D187_005033 [Cystobacter fuscus DSM 2262]